MTQLQNGEKSWKTKIKGGIEIFLSYSSTSIKKELEIFMKQTSNSGDEDLLRAALLYGGAAQLMRKQPTGAQLKTDKH